MGIIVRRQVASVEKFLPYRSCQWTPEKYMNLLKRTIPKPLILPFSFSLNSALYKPNKIHTKFSQQSLTCWCPGSLVVTDRFFGF